MVNRVFGSSPATQRSPTSSRSRHSGTTASSSTPRLKRSWPATSSCAVAPRAEGKSKEQNAKTLEAAASRVARLSVEHPGRSIGVLVRTNGAVRQLIHRLRSEHQIAASEEGGNPLVDSPAVQIILSVLTLADHPGDTAARFHVAHSPLGPTLGIVDHADGPAAHAAMAEVRRRLIDVGYGRTLYDWAQILSAHCDSHDLRRLQQLVALGYSFGERIGVEPGRFVGLVEETKIEDPAAANVRVMTVHQAKGLEFDIVVLPELDKQLKGKTPELAVGRLRPIDPIDLVCRHVNKELLCLLPRKFQEIFEIWPQEAVGESLCLLYVAMTRAIHALYIYVSPSSTASKPTFPKTFAGILRSALVGNDQPLEPETTPYRHGDPAWDRGTASPKPTQAASPRRAAGADPFADQRAIAQLGAAQSVGAGRWQPGARGRRAANGLGRICPRIAVARLAGKNRVARWRCRRPAR